LPAVALWVFALFPDGEPYFEAELHAVVRTLGVEYVPKEA